MWAQQHLAEAAILVVVERIDEQTIKHNARPVRKPYICACVLVALMGQRRCAVPSPYW